MSRVRLSAELESKIRELTARRGLSVSELHRRALAELCERELAQGHTSRFDDVIGAADGRLILPNAPASDSPSCGSNDAQIESELKQMLGHPPGTARQRSRRSSGYTPD